MDLKLILIVCVTFVVISVQVSEGKAAKRHSEGLLVIPTCHGKRLPSHEYNAARKGCKGKKDEMCAYMCIANKLDIVKNNKVDDDMQKKHVKNTYPPKAVDTVMKELRHCRGKYNKNDKSGDCHGNHDWATCNHKAIRSGCHDSE